MTGSHLGRSVIFGRPRAFSRARIGGSARLTPIAGPVLVRRQTSSECLGAPRLPSGEVVGRPLSDAARGWTVGCPARQPPARLASDGRRASSSSLTRIACAHIMRNMNVTLSVDDRVVAEARRLAAVRGTSLDQLVRDFLEELTRVDDGESVVSVVAQLDELWAEESYRSQSSWKRDELYEHA